MMTAAEPRVELNGRYSVSEAAALLGLHRNTVTRLAERRILKGGRHRHNGRRFFTGRELLMFWQAQL